MQMTKAITAEQILAAIEREGTVAKAADALKVSERTLYRRMDAFGIRVQRVAVKEAA
jgi:transcriptional regulator with PAS, ATPase and Fis domain